MAEYRLIIYPTAQRDMEDIVDYVNTLSPTAAFDLYDAIVDGTSTLAHMPQRCALLKTPELRAKGYRALVVRSYVVFFVIAGDIVQIRRILYGRRKYEWLL